MHRWIWQQNLQHILGSNCQVALRRTFVNSVVQDVAPPEGMIHNAKTNPCRPAVLLDFACPRSKPSQRVIRRAHSAQSRLAPFEARPTFGGAWGLTHLISWTFLNPDTIQYVEGSFKVFISFHSWPSQWMLSLSVWLAPGDSRLDPWLCGDIAAPASKGNMAYGWVAIRCSVGGRKWLQHCPKNLLPTNTEQEHYPQKPDCVAKAGEVASKCTTPHSKFPTLWPWPINYHIWRNMLPCVVLLLMQPNQSWGLFLQLLLGASRLKSLSCWIKHQGKSISLYNKSILGLMLPPHAVAIASRVSFTRVIQESHDKPGASRP